MKVVSEDRRTDQAGAAAARGAPAASGCLTLDLADVDRTHAPLVGGKCAVLGELSRIAGVTVPGGVCVTTEAFRHFLQGLPRIDDQLERLSALDSGDQDAVGALSADLRSALQTAPIPGDLESELRSALTRFGQVPACAVRSSATGEDSPTVSFAGQHDTYLNVMGPDAILWHVKRCWGSLFSVRAVIYRLQRGAHPRSAQMAVIIQQMVYPRAAGVLFTADPVTSNRKVTSIEATFGLGEGLVSGLVTPDAYKVQGGRLVEAEIATKERAVVSRPEGGTEEVPVEPERQRQAALDDQQVRRLAELAQRIAAHLGCPQDIEWCLVGDDFQIVQSRPITTLFPIPRAADQEDHVYLSVGHQQMMTDAMKPLGRSLWQLAALRPMHEAGGRLFVDVTRELSSAAKRAALVAIWERGDPLTASALRKAIARTDFAATRADEPPDAPPAGGVPMPIETDPAVTERLVHHSRASLDRLRREIRTKSGETLLDFILADLEELKGILLDPRSVGAIRAGMDARSWLNDHMEAWLGERNASDRLTQSAPGNVTSEMGLALLDVADAIRPHPDVVACLRAAPGETFLETLPVARGGGVARDAIAQFLDAYGMRCVGEIDITRARWSENPTALLPMILSNVEHFETGAGRRRFEQGRREAQDQERDLMARLRALPDGEAKARETKGMIDRLRMFAGYREYPKFHIVSRFFVYKKALLQAADRLVERRALRVKEDIFFLEFDELYDVLRTGSVDEGLLHQRKEGFRWHQALTPPRVLTSDGEVFEGSYSRTDAPPGALPGLPASAGIVEGRARVVTDVAGVELDAGDILVTVYTDPSWTPLFVAINGLVTEIGGLMTHGSVVAREYGVAAVVGVQGATRLIADGQRIRVHGTEGYVEIVA